MVIGVVLKAPIAIIIELINSLRGDPFRWVIIWLAVIFSLLDLGCGGSFKCLKNLHCFGL